MYDTSIVYEYAYSHLYFYRHMQYQNHKNSDVAKELEAAELDHHRAKKRMASARELYDMATDALSGYSYTKNTKPNKEVRKRKVDETNNHEEMGVEHEENLKFAPPDTGPLDLPPVATSGEGLSEEQVTIIEEQRNSFYKKLCGLPYSELSSYTPTNNNSINLKSKAQLEQDIYIVEHWDTGDPSLELSVTDFRRQHKSFYTKLKSSKENVGRRTGHHLRDISGTEGRKAFCRYGKRDESLMYICLEELFDAIFQMHAETGHSEAWQTTKKLVNTKYANIPQDQIKVFIETCHVCSSRKEDRKRQKIRY